MTAAMMSVIQDPPYKASTAHTGTRGLQSGSSCRVYGGYVFGGRRNYSHSVEGTFPNIKSRFDSICHAGKYWAWTNMSYSTVEGLRRLRKGRGYR